MQACSEMKKNPGREEGGGVYKIFFDQLGELTRKMVQLKSLKMPRNP